MSANGSVGQLAAGGTDVVNGQIIAGPWRALYLPGDVRGPVVRGVGGDMSLPTLPYLTAGQTGSANSGAGQVFNPMAIGALVLLAAIAILLMRQIHWS